MAGFTNKGKWLMCEWVFRGVALPSNFYVALVQSPPDQDTNLLSDLTEVPDLNGYTEGGVVLNPDGTDFDQNDENDTDDRNELQIKDVTWTATGDLPSSGGGATHAVLLDDNATPADRFVLAYWDLGGARSVTSGQQLTLQDLELRLTET
jgi:hypothetical protein